MEQEGFRETDASGGVEERFYSVIGGRVQHDLVEERELSVAAAATKLGILVVVESVVCGLAKVTAAEDEIAK